MPLAPILWALPVAAILIAAGWRPWTRTAQDPAPRTGAFASALAVPLCLLAGWYGYHEAWPSLRPDEAREWLFPATAVAALGFVLPRRVAAQVFLGWAAAELLIGAGLGEVLARRYGDHAPWVEAGLKAGMAAHAASLAALSRRAGGEVPLLALIGLVAAATVQRGGYASGALVLAAVGCAVGGGLVLALWRRGWCPLAGAGLAVGAVAGGVLAIGHQLAESPWEASLLAAGAPHLGWLPGQGRGMACVRVLLAAGLAAGAHFLSVPPPNPYAGY